MTKDNIEILAYTTLKLFVQILFLVQLMSKQLLMKNIKGEIKYNFLE